MTNRVKESSVVFLGILVVQLTLALDAVAAAVQLAVDVDSVAADGSKLRVISEQTATGFAFPESVASGSSGLTVFVPDLVTSQLRIVRLGK